MKKRQQESVHPAYEKTRADFGLPHPPLSTTVELVDIGNGEVIGVLEFKGVYYATSPEENQAEMFEARSLAEIIAMIRRSYYGEQIEVTRVAKINEEIELEPGDRIVVVNEAAVSDTEYDRALMSLKRMQGNPRMGRYVVQMGTSQMGDYEEEYYGRFDDLSEAIERAFVVLNNPVVQERIEFKGPGSVATDIMIEDTELQGVKYWYWILKRDRQGSELKGRVNGWVVYPDGRVEDYRR